jgi:hypothetical protein
MKKLILFSLILLINSTLYCPKGHDRKLTTFDAAYLAKQSRGSDLKGRVAALEELWGDGTKNFNDDSLEVLSMLTTYGLAPADGHELEEALCVIENQIANRMPGEKCGELLARDSELKRASKPIMARALTMALPGYLAGAHRELESMDKGAR